jgi:predicted RNase H-like nuclease (RuvC/YqgF family)
MSTDMSTVVPRDPEWSDAQYAEAVEAKLIEQWEENAQMEARLIQQQQENVQIIFKALGYIREIEEIRKALLDSENYHIQNRCEIMDLQRRLQKAHETIAVLKKLLSEVRDKSSQSAMPAELSSVGEVRDVDRDPSLECFLASPGARFTAINVTALGVAAFMYFMNMALSLY